MAYLTKEELTTHLRSESIASITRNDNALAQSAIDGAITEAKGYLSRFDTDAIFSAKGSDRNELLLIFVKDIAAWHLVNIVNPNIEMKLRQDRYERAISWLKDVQKGIVEPDLPKPEDVDTSLTKYGSIEKNEYDW